MTSTERTESACKRLWYAVLQQAIKDSRWDVKAHAWFFSEDQWPGSFLWICTVLDLSPEFIQTLLPTRHNNEAIFTGWSKADIHDLKLWNGFVKTLPRGIEESQRTWPGRMN